MLTVVVASLSVGCGGGGGSDSAKFAGRWIIDQTLVSNTCRFPVEVPEPGAFDINQVGDEIAVEGTTNYSGVVISETAFVASRQTEEQCTSVATGEPTGSTSIVVVTLNFELTSNDMARTSFVVENGNCSGNTLFDSSCRVETIGVAVREDG